MPRNVTGSVNAFDKTLQKSYLWIDEIARDLGEENNRQKAYSALRAVLHALRDRMTVDEAAQLSAQLPMLIRGAYFEGWDPAVNPMRYHRKDEFLERIISEMPVDREESERIAKAVFACLDHHVTEGEINDLKTQLPNELSFMWAH